MPKFSVERSVDINAAPEKVFSVIRDFKQWPDWSPWLISEPDCSLSYAEDGNSYAWEGKLVGSGSMVVTAEDPPQSIHYDLQFLKPWKSQAKVRFLLEPKEEGCRVTWAMDSSLPFFMFWMKPMMMAFIGNDYVRGLNMLKDKIETGTVPSQLEFIGEESLPGFSYVGIRTECAIDDIGPRMESDLKRLAEWVEQKNIQPSAAPFSIYEKWDMVKGSTRYIIGFPVESLPGAGDASVIEGERPSTPVYAIRHTGPYRHLGNAWGAGYNRVQAKVIAQNKKLPPMEIYNNDPRETAEAEIQTTVYFPLKA